MFVPTRDVLKALSRDGYYRACGSPTPEEPVRFIVELARSLGELFVPEGCDPDEPVIRTVPTNDELAAPFDRPAAIGWHGDFATYPDRPALSLVYVTHGDPRGQEFGKWRIASVRRLVESMRSTVDGRAALDLLSTEKLPFSYAEGEEYRWYRIFESRAGAELGLRYYWASLRHGCRAAYGEVPMRIIAATAALERAADAVADTVPTEAGSLLVVNNWFALHDRTGQTVSTMEQTATGRLCSASPLGRLSRQVDHAWLDSERGVTRAKYVSGGTRPSASWGRCSLSVTSHVLEAWLMTSSA